MEDKKYSKKKSLSKREVKFLTKIYDSYNEEEILESIEDEVAKKIGYYEYMELKQLGEEVNLKARMEEEKPVYPVNSLYVAVIGNYHDDGAYTHFKVSSLKVVRELDKRKEAQILREKSKNYYSCTIKRDRLYEVVLTGEIVEQDQDYFGEPKPFRSISQRQFWNISEKIKFKDDPKFLSKAQIREAEEVLSKNISNTTLDLTK